MDEGTFSVDEGTFSVDDGTFSADEGTFSVDDGTFSADEGTFSVDEGTFPVDERTFSVDEGTFSADEEIRKECNEPIVTPKWPLKQEKISPPRELSDNQGRSLVVFVNDSSKWLINPGNVLRPCDTCFGLGIDGMPKKGAPQLFFTPDFSLGHGVMLH